MVNEIPSLSLDLLEFMYTDYDSHLCQLEIPATNHEFENFAVFINVPKQCYFDKIFNYLETVNPTYVILALEPTDSRKGFNEGYHISGKEGNVPWIWSVLGAVSYTHLTLPTNREV